MSKSQGKKCDNCGKEIKKPSVSILRPIVKWFCGLKCSLKDV